MTVHIADILRERASPPSGDLFIKLYISMRKSGLLAHLSDKDFRTLITLATFMDEEGTCYPSQFALARALGVTQSAAAKRVKSLLRIHWQGRPLVTADKTRSPSGRFARTRYAIQPESGLRIFGASDTKKALHIPAGHRADGHTNQSQGFNQTLTLGKNPRRRLPGSPVREDPLAGELARDMRDTVNLNFYRKAVERYPAGVLLRVRGLVLESPNVRNRGALFAYLLKKEEGSGASTRNPPRACPQTF